MPVVFHFFIILLAVCDVLLLAVIWLLTFTRDDF